MEIQEYKGQVPAKRGLLALPQAGLNTLDIEMDGKITTGAKENGFIIIADVPTGHHTFKCKKLGQS